MDINTPGWYKVKRDDGKSTMCLLMESANKGVFVWWIFDDRKLPLNMVPYAKFPDNWSILNNGTPVLKIS